MEQLSIKTVLTDLNTMSGEQIFNAMLFPVIVVVTAFICGLIINNMIARRLADHFDGRTSSIRYIVLRALRGFPLVWLVATSVYWLIRASNIEGPIEDLLSYIVQVLLIFTVIQAIARAVTGVVDIYAQRNPNLPQTTLMGNVLNVLIYAIGILIILDSLGISITPLITAMGVGGMAVALGLQETLANICAGMYLLVSKQLNIGDYVKLSSGEMGQVSDITWRFTTIISASGNAIIVPNKQISSSIIINYCQPEPDMAIAVECGVSYDSDLDRVEAVVLEVANAVTEEVTGQSDNKSAEVYFHTFNDSSIDFTTLLHCRVFTQQRLLKHAFIKALTKRFAKEGIEIPFPIRTVYSYRGAEHNEPWDGHTSK